MKDRQPNLTPDQALLWQKGWRPCSGSGAPNGFWLRPGQKLPEARTVAEKQAVAEVKGGK